MQLNGSFLNGGVQGISKGEDYRAADMVFPLVCDFINRETGYT